MRNEWETNHPLKMEFCVGSKCRFVRGLEGRPSPLWIFHHAHFILHLHFAFCFLEKLKKKKTLGLTMRIN